MNNRKKGLQVIICGRGGQGVLFLTRLIDEVALAAGCDVISSETHGMAMRGGSVMSCIRIGPFTSPLIRSGQADIIMALAESEVPLTMHLVKKEHGQLYVNSLLLKEGSIDASGIAAELGSVVVSNLVLLGFACAHREFPFSFATVQKVLKRISSPKVLDINIRALDAGYKRAKGIAQEE